MNRTTTLALPTEPSGLAALLADLLEHSPLGILLAALRA